ncbi:MAG: hypothetical protein J6Q22_03245 [Prevotella sp.]|nr:hypothetical protein [Prevotella sp.]
MNKMAGTTGAGGNTTAETENGLGKLFFCDAKNQSQMNDFVKATRPKLVALMGFEGYGKSTFIGSLYQLLIQNEVYQGYTFVDSETYVGFERRVFLRRVNKDNVSDTKRNVLGDNDILDLQLRSDRGVIHRVLVSDKAGETYRQYISSDEEAGKDIVLSNADIVLFFVDAEADSQKLAEHNLIMEKYESVLTRLVKQQKIGSETEYYMVFTKIDKVVGEDRRMKLVDRKNKICGKFAELIGSDPLAVYEVNSHDIDDASLNTVFGQIIAPRNKTSFQPELDWVKMEIEKNL